MRLFARRRSISANFTMTAAHLRVIMALMSRMCSKCDHLVLIVALPILGACLMNRVVDVGSGSIEFIALALGAISPHRDVLDRSLGNRRPRSVHARARAAQTFADACRSIRSSRACVSTGRLLKESRDYSARRRRPGHCPRYDRACARGRRLSLSSRAVKFRPVPPPRVRCVKNMTALSILQLLRYAG